MPKHRKALENAKFEYRREHPDEFRYVCETCVPQRRFRHPNDKSNHDQNVHGILTAATSMNSFAYPLPQSLPRSSMSACSRSASLSSIAATELNSFVLKEIEPDTAYNQSCRAVVDRLCQFMQNNFPDQLRPSEVRKSGSLGKGTAVKGKSDADLVVFLASYHNISTLRDNLRDILARMKLYLGKYGGCDVEGTTLHAVKVSVTCHGHSHSVDILPIADILKYNSKNAIYAEMASSLPAAREYYSAALAPLQVDFVSEVPTKVKALIRLIKYWRKTEFEESTGHQRLPSSYPLELIVIGEWQDVRSPQNFNLCKGFYHVLRAIGNYRSLKHAWTVNYNSNYVSDPFYVVDPANPFNNVMNACNCWDLVAEKARTFLWSPLFQGISTLDGWL